MVGLGGLEPPTPALSERCSDQLSYKPFSQFIKDKGVYINFLLRKEVIQPHLPVRLPCYDLVPLADHTFVGCYPYGFAHQLRVQSTRLT